MKWPLLLLFVLASCAKCDGGGVAELRGIVGSVQRDFADKQGVWHQARAGSVLHVGDALRTGQGARAELLLPPDGRLRVEGDTIVRFSDAPPGESHAGKLEVEAGEVEVMTGAAELLVDAPTGVARVSQGSRVRVHRTGREEIGVEVAVGRAHIEQGGELVTAHAGEQLALAIGSVEVESLEPIAPAEVEPAAPEPAAEVTNEESATGVTIESSIEPAELVLEAGESATVHDPSTPAVVGLHARDCTHAEVDVRDFRGGLRRVRGDQVIGVRLAAGAYRYALRCLGDTSGESRATGVVRVVRDSGARKLPRSAPRVSVDADGRRYNVRYQNLLPELRLRWPGAPQASSYTLELRGNGQVITEASDSPELRLRSGRVREGEYFFTLRTATQRSPETALRVALDDSARTAQLIEPRDESFTPGGEVRVAGAALSGSAVRINGQAVTLGGDGRFGVVVQAPAHGTALAVRVQHPIAGVHYYVRRAAGAR